MAEIAWYRQKARTPRGSEEHDEQVLFFKVLAANEKSRPELRYVYAVPNGGYRNKATAAKLKAEGTRRGISDVCIPIPSNGFHGAYFEFKSKTGALSREQKEFADFVMSRGYKFFVARSAKEALKELQIYLGVEFKVQL